MTGTCLTIDCDACLMRDTDVCEDCVVTFLCDDGGGAVVFDAGEARAVTMLARAGLTPGLRHRRAS
jgi:hypothetical protein